MDRQRQQAKDRARGGGYFGNVKSRLGSKLPTGVSQSPGFITVQQGSLSSGLGPAPTGIQPASSIQGLGVTGIRPASSSRGLGLTGIRPVPTQSLTPAGPKGCYTPKQHVPFIRNPQLRKYYLNDNTSLPVHSETTPLEGAKAKESNTAQHDTVFSIASQCIVSTSNATGTQPLPWPSSASSQLGVSESRLGAYSQTSWTEPLQPTPKQNLELPEHPPLASSSPCTPISPSTDAEYDKLLDVEAVPMPDGELCLLALPPECSQGEGSSSIKYLKLCSRYITNRKGVVSGILLVTASKVFFDPCKSHPLVLENGCEEYVLSCSVDSLASVAFYSDISRVHFNESTQRWKGRKKSSAKVSPQGGVHSTAPQPCGGAIPALVSSLTSDLRVALAITPEGGELGDKSEDLAEVERRLTGSPLEELALQTTGSLGTAVLSGAAATFCCGGEETGGRELSLADQSALQDSPQGRKSQRSGGSGNVSKLMFVRLRHQQPLRRKKSTSRSEKKKSAKTTSQRDFWFTLPQESSSELYAYLSQYRPDLCLLKGGEEEEKGEEDDEEDFVLVDDSERKEEDEENDREEEESEPFYMDSRTGDDWEMISVEDGGVKGAIPVDKEPEGLRDILEQSRILEASHVQELASELPPCTVGHTWHLVYSTSRHGSSLKTLYRKLTGSDSPVLIIIKDANEQMFGGFLSHPLRPSDKFYGTGETFLFLLHPRFKCFKWTGENSFFIKGDLDSFAIGGGSGHFGLWLDETLYLGRSSPCYTFNNCCLSETGDFRVMELEVWTFR